MAGKAVVRVAGDRRGNHAPSRPDGGFVHMNQKTVLSGVCDRDRAKTRSLQRLIRPRKSSRERGRVVSLPTPAVLSRAQAALGERTLGSQCLISLTVADKRVFTRRRSPGQARS